MHNSDDASHDDAPPGRDSIGGDQVGGDKLTTGDIAHSTVAIGEAGSVTAIKLARAASESRSRAFYS